MPLPAPLTTIRSGVFMRIPSALPSGTVADHAPIPDSYVCSGVPAGKGGQRPNDAAAGPPPATGAPSQVQQHAVVAEGVRLDPVEVQELGNTLVIGAQQLVIHLMRDGRPVDLHETVPREEPGRKG